MTKTFTVNQCELCDSPAEVTMAGYRLCKPHALEIQHEYRELAVKVGHIPDETKLVILPEFIADTIIESLIFGDDDEAEATFRAYSENRS